jgi:type II secretory pathway pseudopilin PulG
MHLLHSHQFERRGITLLEVLLAIGILSIGLLSILALLPAGRTLVMQAERDDRAAAIIPDALATMEALGLFTENSLEWRSVKFPQPPAAPLTDEEGLAERPEWHARTTSPPWRLGTMTQDVLPESLIGMIESLRQRRMTAPQSRFRARSLPTQRVPSPSG